MTDDIRPLIAGNWKMNGLKASMDEFEAMLAGASEVADKADLLVCPPATLIAAFAENPGAGTIGIGGVMYDRPHLERARQLLARAKR